MKISPINSNSQVAHKKVDMKYYRKAYETYKNYAPYQNQGHLLTMLEVDIAYGLLSYQDARDTLIAIKPFSNDAKEVIDNMIEDLEDLIKKGSHQ